ncbi:MAG: hypothetical protein ABIP17_12595 [Ilumatobacteraceae bacterium]
MEPLVVAERDDRVSGSTPRQNEARASITRTTITPAPGTIVAEPEPEKKRRRTPKPDRGAHGDLASADAPYPGPNVLRLVLSVVLSALCLLTVGGAILLLLLWQQDRASGVLTSQLDRTWDIFDQLRRLQNVVALIVVPIAMVWMALAAINVKRATGIRRNPIVAAASLPVGVFGAWYAGHEIVSVAEDFVGQAAGVVLQAVFLAIPLLAILRIAQAAEARHRPARAAFLAAVAFVIHLQFFGGLSTIDQQSTSDEWGRLGAYLIISALLQVLGALSINEAARAIEDGSQHRYDLRHRFGESLLAQASDRG